MDFAASLRNLFKKRDFKDEVEKSLGQDKNFEKVHPQYLRLIEIYPLKNNLQVLTDVFAVYAELGFFHQADWETTIIKSITNVNPSPQSDAYAIPDTGACTDYGAQTDPEAPRYSITL